ncbi:MAG: hypothetical protein A2521_04310 [Deltaproteobacteria bacterium RIFOXYD12_FULL_57_12]|nr:MAG: hypothetical protein A2521_04310 [Deltaproteobacteria bacterium RIFOXYD12_FULL_57_12]
METLTQLLRQSIAQYSEILGHIRLLPRILAHSQPRELEAYRLEMQVLQEKAERTDEQLAALPKDTAVSNEDKTLLQQRQVLLQEITTHNDLHFPKITGKMTVIAADLSQMRDNITAMSGYKVNLGKSGGIINTAH